MMVPAVSIIVATLDAGRFLSQALDSIVAQSVDDYEVLVVDGGSVDGTLEIARSYPRVTVLRQPGKGYLDAWNAGLASARAPFVAFLDSDDHWSADKLSAQLAVFVAEPGLDAVFGRIRFFLEPGCPMPANVRPQLLEGSHLAPMCGNALIRRRAVDRIGTFDDRLPLAGDIAWISRLRETCAIAFVDKIVLHKRLHAANLGHVTAGAVFRRELLALAKARIDGGRGGRAPWA